MIIPLGKHIPVMLGVGAWLVAAAPGFAQGPSSPGPKAGAAHRDVAPAPTRANPEATVAEPTGPIAVETTVADADLRATLEELLSRYPGVHRIEATVDHGVVTLAGHVEDGDVRDRIRDLARRVEGVRLVINDVRTDSQVLGPRELAARRLQKCEWLLAREWSPALLACGMVVGSVASARLFGRHAEALLSPFIADPHRPLVASLVGLLMIGGGVLFALSLLGLSESVLSVLGLAGAVGGAKAHLPGRRADAGDAVPAPKRPRPRLDGRFRRFRRGQRVDAAQPAGPIARGRAASTPTSASA